MKSSNGLKITAEIPMGLLVAFMIFMGLGEMIGGEFSGIQHLITATAVLLLMWFAWKRPYPAGVILIALAFAIAIFTVSSWERGIPWYIPASILGVPLLITGVLLLVAARKTLKTTMR